MRRARAFNFQYQVILSHGPGCKDGATAAWCFWRTLPQDYRHSLSNEGGFYALGTSSKMSKTNDYINGFLHANSPEGALKLQERGFPVVFVFIQPGDTIPDALIENKSVVILDLDIGDSLLRVVELSSSVLLVDHHDSTPMTLNKYSEQLFGTYANKFTPFVNNQKSESGATLAWKLTHKNCIPPLVDVVRIGDNWQWEDRPELKARFVLESLHNKRSFRSFPDIENTFINWDRNFKVNVQNGQMMFNSRQSLVKQIAKQCDIGFIQTNDGAVYNIAHVECNVLHSEVGAMMKRYAQNRYKVPIHFCATWKYVSYKSMVSVSLRDNDPHINLASIAQNIKGSSGQGGGHTEASSFSFYGIENLHNYILKSHPVLNYSFISEYSSNQHLHPEISLSTSDSCD